MSITGDPFLAPRCNTDLILATIRQQLFHRRGAGRQHVVAFLDAFTAWDGDGDKRLSSFEFEKALGRCGVFLPAQELSALFRRFDAQGDGRADAQQVLSALRLPLNKRRLAVVDAAFSSILGCPIETGKIATIESASARDHEEREERPDPLLSDALARMAPEKHPDVVTGRLRAQEIKDDFSTFFSSRATSTRRCSPAMATISMEDFREYYRDVGVCEPYDGVFVPMIEEVWGVIEPRRREDKLSELAGHLRPKLLQHSHHAETPAEVLRKALRYYSQSSGAGAKQGVVVGADGVEKTLNTFGLYPDRETIAGIFSGTGSTLTELCELDELVAIFCPPEPPLAPMF